MTDTSIIAPAGRLPHAGPCNALLAAMSAADRAWMAERLRPLELNVHDAITEIGEPNGVVFPDSGVVSLVARTPDIRLEVGLVGREGAIGVATVLGVGSVPVDGFVRIAGRRHRIGPDAMAEALERPGIRSVMLAHMHLTYVQLTQTALANGRCTIEERLARWLLMVQDRQGGADVRVTLEFLSLALGVHRPGVTLAMCMLEGAHLVRFTPGLATIRDREGLIEVAGPAYGIAEAERARVFPTTPTTPTRH